MRTLERRENWMLGWESCRFSYIAFIMWGNAASTLLPRTFIMKACWIFVKDFSASFVFKFIYIEPSLYLRDKASFISGG